MVLIRRKEPNDDERLEETENEIVRSQCDQQISLLCIPIILLTSFLVFFENCTPLLFLRAAHASRQSRSVGIHSRHRSREQIITSRYVRKYSLSI